MRQGSTDIFNTYHLCVGIIFLTHKCRRSYNKKAEEIALKPALEVTSTVTDWTPGNDDGESGSAQ